MERKLLPFVTCGLAVLFCLQFSAVRVCSANQSPDLNSAQQTSLKSAEQAYKVADQARKGGDESTALRGYAEALKGFTPLAKLGDPEAEFDLGKMYYLGQGVLKEPDEATKWFKASAEQGNANAQFFLGTIYYLPHKDIAQGLRWLRLSAEQGNQDAQLLLGQAYLQNFKELPLDPVQADMWLRLAARNNLPFYTAQLQTAEKGMNEYQIAKARMLAKAWKPKHGLRPTADLLR